MARRVSQRELIRAQLGGKPAKKIVIHPEQVNDDLWRAKFAVPGTIPDYTRRPDGEIVTYRTEQAALFSAMIAAIDLFNSPRERLGAFGGQRFRVDGVHQRPAKPTPEDIAVAMRQADVDITAMVYLFDKRSDRIKNWINTGDMPHEAWLLLQLMANIDGATEMAFNLTGAAVDKAKTNPPVS